MKTTLSKNALDAMQENLNLARYAIDHKKSDEENAGCYGVSAVILLSSILDSIGTFYCLDKMATKSNIRISNPNFEFRLYENQYIGDWDCYVGTTKSHFKQVYKNFLTITGSNYGFPDRDTFVNILYKTFRCELVHNGTTNIGISISNDEEKLVIKKTNANSYILYLKPFLDMVRDIKCSFLQQHKDEIEKDLEVQGFEVIEANTGVTFENVTQQITTIGTNI